MIVLTVTHFNAEPCRGVSARFGELGGTIGRSDSNQLMLDDPERTISRIHARIVYRRGAFAVVDTGSNPISVNGCIAGSGEEVPLRPGDVIEIGAYRLLASADVASGVLTGGSPPPPDHPSSVVLGSGNTGAVGSNAHPVPATPRSPAILDPTSSVASSESTLRAAFLTGLGTAELPLQALNAGCLTLVGQLLRETAIGIIGLLAARTAFNQTWRVAPTMISAAQNNPLKFSPSGESALHQLLGPQVPGFMPPKEAMRDAFEDLQAHEQAVRAAMFAALDAALQQFDPALVASRLSSSSTLGGLNPWEHKARLWDLFEAQFGQLQHQGRVEFETVFGKAFVAAFEDKVQRLREARNPD